MEKTRRVRAPRARGSKTAMPVVIRGVPPGYNWGWYSREDPRMHLQSVDGEHDYKVWLEEKGGRVFLPDSPIPRKVLRPLQAEVADHRRFVEDKWVRFMLDQDWLRLHVALPQLTLVAYPSVPAKFVRKIDLRTWISPEQLTTLTPEAITLNREIAALRLWADRTDEEVPYDARLSTLLWQD